MKRNSIGCSLLLLFVCMGGPLQAETKAALVIGKQPPGSVIMYAAGAGDVASDGRGRNGLFTEKFLETLRTPGLDVAEVFRLTGHAVQQASNGEQHPSVYNQFFGRYTLTSSSGGSPPSGPSSDSGRTSTFIVEKAYGNVNVVTITAGTLYRDGVRQGTIPAGSSARLENFEAGMYTFEMHYDDNEDEKTVSFYFDFSGESIHKRGYRVRSVEAGLKENIAAAVLYRCDWNRLTKKTEGPYCLVDPMCGSGTIVIEAALMAINKAPGLFRASFGFMKWKQHDQHLWDRVKQEAKEGERASTIRLAGFDCDKNAIQASKLNAEKAGVSPVVSFTQKSIVDVRETDFPHVSTGLIVTNPPYGGRMGEESELYPLYQALGRTLKRYFSGWNGAVLTGNKKLARCIGLQADKIHTLFNGPISCGLYHFILNENNRFSPQIYPLSLEKRGNRRYQDSSDKKALYNRIEKR